MANVDVDSRPREWHGYTERQPGEFNSDLNAIVSALTRASAYGPLAKIPVHEWTKEQVKGFKSCQADVEESQSAFALHVGAAALTAYKAGEMDLLSVLNVVATSSHLCGREVRVGLLGQTALAALELGHPKSVKRRKSLYPRWIKDLAVDIVVILLSTHPKMALTLPVNSGPQTSDNIDSWRAIQWAADILSVFRLGPAPALLWREGEASRPPIRPTQWISSRTIHRWYGERMRELGKSTPRGRPRSRLPASIR